MRAFFAGGVEKMHIPWAVEGLPMLLHLSLFLFFGGLAIFLFHVNREVFRYVIYWIGLFLMVYGMITLLPLIRQDSPYNSPLSGPAWFLFAAVTYVTLKILFLIILFCGPLCIFFSFCSSRIDRIVDRVVTRTNASADYCRRRMLGGVEKVAEETASERSSEIDLQILEWTISAQGDDDSLKSFFEAIPGFFNSKLVDHQKHFPGKLVKKFAGALGGFLVRTWSSNSVDGSEKARRLDISLNVINQIGQTHDPFIIHRILYQLRHEVSQTVDMGHAIARLFPNNDQDIPCEVQRIISEIFLSVRERSDSRVRLAARLYGLPERVIGLRGDDLSFATLIHVARQYFCSNFRHYKVLEALSKLDMGNTLPRLQHDFCTLWNELVQEATNKGFASPPVLILNPIRHLYIALHQGTDAAPTAFSASTLSYYTILFNPSSYPLCNLASHRPDSNTHVSLPIPTAPSCPPSNDDDTALRQAEQVNNTIEPPSSSDLTTIGEFRGTSHGPDITPLTNPVYSNSLPTGASLTVVVATVPQDVTSTATLSRPLEGREQQNSDIVTTGAELGTTASTRAPTPTIPPVPTSPPDTPSESYDAGVASDSNSPHPEPLSISSSIPASRLTGSPTLPRLRPRGLLNTRNICFANAVLQLLVNSPPFWNLFRELGDLKAERRAGVLEPGGSTSPLVDATVRFLKEFSVEEESFRHSGDRSRPQGEHQGPMNEGMSIPLSIRSNQRACMMQ
jgi:hypothetical protein